MAVVMRYNSKADATFRRMLHEERQLAAGSERIKKLTPAEHRRRIELQQRKDPRFKMLCEDGDL